jgi:hypothetical protein
MILDKSFGNKSGNKGSGVVDSKTTSPDNKVIKDIISSNLFTSGFKKKLK